MSYRQALAQPMLSRAEELELIDRWRRLGDEAARDRVVATHMRICYKVAAMYASNDEHVKDLAQEGVQGLLDAMQRFDPERDTRFGTYATWWVRTHVAQGVSSVALVVDVPSRTYLKARSADGGGAADWVARQAAKGEIALDAPVGDEDGGTMADLVPDRSPDPEAIAIEADREATFRRCIDDALERGMTPREAMVLRMRRLSEVGHTLDEISGLLSVSRERVRQIECTAVEKLRRHLVKQGFTAEMLR